ncbi:MAG TPA: tetratricopeptide repeat protein [Chryseolinea sp.]|nr:tetratricopeptide repeat protein [Chryseolinea sp.]HPM29899.1 tetratricopeptide repeat protein [Chryseolinea sp.]
MEKLTFLLRFTLIGFFLLLQSSLFGQQPKTDSLNQALQRTQVVHQLAWKNGDSLSIVQSGRTLVELYNKLVITDSIFSIGDKILVIAKRNNWLEEQGDINESLGRSFLSLSRYDLAMQYLFNALAIQEQLKDETQTSNTLIDIGRMYYEIKDDRKALEYFERALRIKNERSDNENLQSLFLNMSLCYSRQHDFVNSRLYIDRVKYACAKKLCLPTTLLTLEVTEGFHFLRMDSLTEAENSFKRGNQLAQKIQNARFGFDCILNLSKIFLQQGKIDLATQYLEEIKEWKTNEGFNSELLQLYTQLIEVYKKVDNHQKVAYYQERYIQLKDSVSGEEVRNKLMHVQADFLQRENKAKVESQTTLLELQDGVIKRQKTVRLLIAGVVALFILLAFFLYKANQNRKHANTLLDRKVEKQTRELEKSYRDLKVAMEQRDVTIRKVAVEIRNSMATVKGLCATGLKDITLPGSQAHLIEIENASKILSESAKQILDDPSH